MQLDAELLIYQVATLKPALAEALDGVDDGATLRIDCAALQELDAAGLQLLVSAAQALAARQGRILLVACPAAIRRMIGEAGLAPWFVFDEVPQ